MNHYLKDNRSGYIVLMAIIVIGAVAFVSSLLILTISAESSQNSAIIQQSNQAKALANACAEYALDALHQNSAYSGNETLTLGVGNCVLAPINLVADLATIQSIGTVQNTIRKVEVIAQVTVTTEETDPEAEPPAEPISTITVQLQSWQEVGDF